LLDCSDNELQLSGNALAELMNAVFAKNAGFRFKAKGHSMSPFIRSQDVLTLSNCCAKKLEKGDIVAFINPANGKVVVHRIVGEITTGAVIKGDNCRESDGFITHGDIIGIVTIVERNGKRVWCGNGREKKLIASISRTRLLNTIILPLLRKIKNVFSTTQPVTV
jgi:hypothetical protein